jgi:PRTRC genetic system protein B
MITTSYDLDGEGRPVNAHPLSVTEAGLLARSLENVQQKGTGFLEPEGLLPENLLYLNPLPEQEKVIWYTPPTRRQLFFVRSLGLPSEKACVPSLLWVATKTGLRLFGLKGDHNPTLNTPLYYAPFFNLYQVGSVCMGTVDIALEGLSLEGFIRNWEQYFFGSYFSHLIDGHNPVKGNLISLWKNLLTTGQPFPVEKLINTCLTLKKLIG